MPLKSISNEDLIQELQARGVLVVAISPSSVVEKNREYRSDLANLNVASEILARLVKPHHVNAYIQEIVDDAVIGYVAHAQEPYAKTAQKPDCETSMISSTIPGPTEDLLEDIRQFGEEICSTKESAKAFLQRVGVMSKDGETIRLTQ